MQAITTRFAGPTDTRGSRIIARADAGRLTVGWDHSLDVEGNHRAAAAALAVALDWTEVLDRYGFATGSLPGDAGYVHVFILDISHG